MSLSVAIVGAGYAGLACAVELARHGHFVTVFERSNVLGGRARVVARDGWRVDNGQHILIGAYTELARLLRLTGVSPKTLERLPLTVHVPGSVHLRAAHLPAPLHLLVGLIAAKGLDRHDKWAMVGLMRHLRKQGFRLDPRMTVRELLETTTQTGRITESVWAPLCVAALNTPIADASAQVFANVLRDSLAADAGASELLIPRVDLSELFPVQAARYLAVRRGKVRTGTPITAIEPTENGLRLQGDPADTRVFEHVVVATAPYHAADLVRSTDRCDRLAQQIEQFDYEPITTVYLALGPGQSFPHAMIGLTDGPAQWAFDRGRLGSEPGLIACVISAHGPHEQLGREDLEIAVLQQLERQLGRRLPSPEWALTITEKRATFACRPGLNRPGIRTPVPGLWLAGDYTDSPYPATLESAVRSGIAAAGEIARRGNASASSA